MVRTEQQEREETERLLEHHHALDSEHKVALEKRLLLELIRSSK